MVFPTVLLLTVFCPLVLAEEVSVVRLQGAIMELDLKKNILIVNERVFVCDQKTTFHNEKGVPVGIEKLRVKSWVYIEGERDEARKRLVAKKIYLLPRYIGRKERRLYPFIPRED